MSIRIRYLLGFMRFWHDLPTYSGPEKETNSAHILRLFWGAVLAVACRDSDLWLPLSVHYHAVSLMSSEHFRHCEYTD